MKVLRIFVREIAAILVVVAFLFVGAQQAHAQTAFNYPQFPTSAATGLQVNGSASVMGTTPNYLQLTPASGGQVGSAWYTNPAATSGDFAPAPLPLQYGFTATFIFQFTGQGGSVNGSNGTTGADGIAFVVQNGGFADYGGDTSSGASAVGPSDGLGGEIGFTGLTNSVAVQLDTWCNSEYGDTCATNDPYSSASQITVESCGTAANTVNHNASPTCSFGTVDLSTIASPAFPIYLADGKTHYVQISYTPPTAAVAAAGGTCPPGSTSGTSNCGSLSVAVDNEPVLIVPFNLGYINGYKDSTDSAYVGFTGATGGAYEIQNITSWTLLANTTAGVINSNSQPIPTLALGTPAANLTTNYSSTPGAVFSSTVGFEYAGGLIYGDAPCPAGNCTLLSSNNPLTTTQAASLMTNTPWAMTNCTPYAALQGNCAQVVNVCYTTPPGVSGASDMNCPYMDPEHVSVPSDYINLISTWDFPSNALVAPMPGTTFSFTDFSQSSSGETWQPGSSTSVCSNVQGVSASSLSTPPTPTTSLPPAAQQCDLSDAFTLIEGDQSTEPSAKKPKGSTFVTGTNSWMPLTKAVVSNCPAPATATSPLNDTNLTDSPFENPAFAANIWNNGNCHLDFLVYPANPPTPWSNGYLPAPPAVFFWGTGTPAVVPYPKASLNSNYWIPVPEGDTAYYNPNPIFSSSCPSANNSANAGPCTWDVLANTPTTILSALGVSVDGRYTIHWSSSDTVGISEKNIQVIPAGSELPCPDPLEIGPFTAPCYSTSYFTTVVNVDSTNPNITGAFSTPGNPAGTFYEGDTVYPVYTCSDPLNNNVASGIANCAGTQPAHNANGSCQLNPASVTSSTRLNTSSPGTFPYPQGAATDCAGNMATSLTPSTYTVVPAVNLQINTIPLLSLNTTIPGLLPLTYGAAITNLSSATAGDITVTTTFTSLPNGVGPASANIYTVTCSNSPCTLKGITLTPPVPCVASGLTVTCSVSTLGPASAKTGLWMEIVLPVSKTAKAGTFKSTSTVYSSDHAFNSVPETYTIIF